MAARVGLGSHLPHSLDKGVGASAYASRPAPAGYRWDFVTSQGARVTSGGRPVVDLVRIA